MKLCFLICRTARSHIPVRAVFLALLFACIWEVCTTSAFAATRSWTGDGPADVGGYKYWSHPNNWSPNGAPQNGENLWFSDPLSADVFMINDLTNLTVKSLRFAIGDIGDASVHLYGYPLGISHGISNTFDFECQVYIHCDVRLAGNATFVTGNTETKPTFTFEDVAMHFLGSIDLNGNFLVLQADAATGSEGRLYIEGGISGAGNVVVIANGIPHFGIDSWGIVEFKGLGNVFSGTLTLNPETLAQIVFNVSSGVVVNNLLIVTNVGEVTFVRPEQIGHAATVRLQDGAALRLY